MGACVKIECMRPALECAFCTEAGGHFLAPCSGAETSVALGIMSHFFLLAE